MPRRVMTDSMQLSDVITKGCSTTEKRFKIDIASARQSYNEPAISQFGLVSSNHDIADGLTKHLLNDGHEALIDTRVDTNSADERIMRN